MLQKQFHFVQLQGVIHVAEGSVVQLAVCPLQKLLESVDFSSAFPVRIGVWFFVKAAHVVALYKGAGVATTSTCLQS